VLVITLGRHPAQLVAALLPFLIAFIVIAAKTTRGGVRWRWGDDD